MTPTTSPSLSPAATAATSPRRRLSRGIANFLLLAFLLGTVWNILHNPDWQRDVLLRQSAIRAWHAGLNPYDPADITRVAGDDFETAYIYPPDTLPFFAVFASFDAPVARALYLGLQLAALAALLVCWARVFLAPGDRANPVFYALCLFGLGGTLFVEMRVGNISLLEQALLWWGLAAWLRGRYTLFAILLWLAAACKLTPLAFSVLLLLPPVRQWLLFAAVWLTMALRLGLDRLVDPTLFGQFVRGLTAGVGGAHEGGRNNPCAVEFLKDLVHLVNDGLEDKPLLTVVLPLYAVAVLAVLGVSWWAWRALCRRHAATGGEETARDVRGICLVCLAYTLTVPRMKDYSYILLLLPVWLVWKSSLARHPWAWLGLVFAACLSDYSYLPLVEAFYTLLWCYLPYIVAAVAWVLLLREMFARPLPVPDAISPREVEI